MKKTKTISGKKINNGYYVHKDQVDGFIKGKSIYVMERTDNHWVSVTVKGRNPKILHRKGDVIFDLWDVQVINGDLILAEIEKVIE